MIYFFTLIIVFSLVLNFSLLTILASATLVILLLLGSHEKVPYNPYYFFSTVPISIMFYDSKQFPHFLMEISLGTSFIIFLGIWFFILGLFIKKTRNDMSTKKSISRSFWVIFMLGTFPYLLSFYIAGVPIFHEGEVDLIRQSTAIPIISQLSLFLPISIISAFQTKSNFKIILSIFTAILFSIAMVSKFLVLFTLIFVIFSLFRYGANLRIGSILKASILPSILAIPLLFALSFELRNDLDQSDYQWRDNISVSNEWVASYGDYLYLPYLYMTSSWSNVAYSISKHERYEYGLMSAKPLISLLQLDSFVTYPPKPIYQYPMNTHAFITDFYLDGGIFGVIVLSLILGFLVKIVYINSISKFDPLMDGLMISVSFAVLMMFFSNHFTSVGYPLVIFVLITIYRYIASFVYRLVPRKKVC